MASSGSFSGSIVSGHYKLRVDWSQSQNVSANTSVITCKLYLVNDWSLNIGSRTNSCTINGTAKSFTSSAVSTTGTHLLGTVSQSVVHDNDGAKSISISAVFKIQATISGTYYEQITASASVTLNTIPRASSVSAKSVNMGTATNISVSRASSNFTHTLSYKFGSASGTIATKTTSTSVSWTPPLSLANQIPKAVSGTCTITCTTFSGNTSIGSKNCTLTLTVPNSVKPAIGSFTASRIDGDVPSDWGLYISTKSKAKLTISGAVGSYGSTISAYSISGGGYSGTSSALTTGFLNASGNISFSAKVTDSRGRVSDTKTVTIKVEKYAPPFFTDILSQRCTNSGALSDDGSYIKSTVTCGCYGSKNTLTTAVYYKKNSDTSWINANKSFKSGTAFVFGGNISTESSYDIKYVISDAFSSLSVIDMVSTAAVVMDFKKGGKGISVGKVAETDNCFEVAQNWDLKVYGKILRDYIYPVGSIYISVNATSPAVLFGGTWVQLKDRFLLGCGTTYSNGTTGGAATVTLTTGNMPSHSHGTGASGYYFSTAKPLSTDSVGRRKIGTGSTAYVTSATAIDDLSERNATGAAGGGSAHNNMPPYLAVYMWKRTA